MKGLRLLACFIITKANASLDEKFGVSRRELRALVFCSSTSSTRLARSVGTTWVMRVAPVSRVESK